MKTSLVKLQSAIAQRMTDKKVYRHGVDVRASTFKVFSYRWVLIITLFFTVFYVGVASDRYVTTAEIYVKSTRANTTVLPQLSLIAGAGGQAHDALLLKTYILSADMLRHLQKKLNLQGHFSSSEWDIVFRMEKDPSDENFLDYYRSRVTVGLDSQSGILSVKGQGFTPEFSRQLVQEILLESERFINAVSQKIAADEVAFVEGELVRARDNLSKARDELLQFQNENKVLDPAATGAAYQGVINELEGELVRLSAEEKRLASYLNDDASELVALRDGITALEQQLAQEKQKFMAPEAQSINELNAEYQERELSLSFAKDVYKAALQAFEQTRVESYHKLKHLVVVQSPQTPDEALMPRRLYDVVTFFVFLSLAYGIVVMILATIREHRDV